MDQKLHASGQLVDARKELFKGRNQAFSERLQQAAFSHLAHLTTFLEQGAILNPRFRRSILHVPLRFTVDVFLIHLDKHNQPESSIF